MTDLDQLDIMRRAITALGLGQCAPEELVAAARTSESSREQTRRALSDANGRIKELEAKIASNVAEAAARDMRIAELERDLAAKDKSLKTAHAALKRICELLCAPVPVCPEDAVTAVCSLISECEIAKSESAESTEIATALNDAGAPRVYHLEDGGEREIPTAERIRLLGERVHTLRAQVREAADATNYLNDLIEAHNALDSLNAPRLADGCVLSLAARVRSLPR
jgi:seryl-tRNA synthetase